MKLRNNMLTLASAGAAFLTLTTYGGAGKNSDLNLGAYTNQFTVSVASSAISISPSNAGSWTAASGSSAPVVSDGYMVIANDLEDTPNTFRATSRTATTTPMVVTELELTSAAVPSTVRTTPSNDTQTAFCITKTDSTSKFTIYSDGAWVDLDGVTPPSEGTDYTLQLTFDYKSGNYVKAAVKLSGASSFTDLYTNNSSCVWFKLNVASATGIQDYCFVGDGKVKSFKTDVACIASEDVKIDDSGTVVQLPEAEKKAIDAVRGDKTAAEYLKQTTAAAGFTTVQSGLNVSEAIALGFLKSNDANTGIVASSEPTLKVTGDALANSDDFKISVNVNKPANSNAEIKYTLQGSTDGTTYTDVSGYANQDAVPTIPTSLIGTESGKYLFFKVKVSVDFPTANE